MAVTVAQIESDGTSLGHVFGDLRAQFIDVTPDASWLAAGEALAASAFGLNQVLYVAPAVKGGYVFTYDIANSKLLAFYGNFDASDGPLIAVPDTTDISGVGAVRLMAIGH
jgi:hypothetical protein